MVKNQMPSIESITTLTKTDAFHAQVSKFYGWSGRMEWRNPVKGAKTQNTVFHVCAKKFPFPRKTLTYKVFKKVRTNYVTKTCQRRNKKEEEKHKFTLQQI